MSTSSINFFHIGTKFCFFPAILMSSAYTDKNKPCFRCVGGVNSAREQDSSIGRDTKYVRLGLVHMEEEVQDRVQVEVGREEQSKGETHGKSQNEETTRNKR